MTQFLDVRIQPVGGEVAKQVAVCQGTGITNYSGILIGDLLNAIQGRHVLVATHGFNVDRENGIASLSNWASLLQLGSGSAFVGFLWPGDSVWAHGLDYPGEPRVADDAGALLGPFIDTNFADAASVSFASHSLGARVALATITNMRMRVRRLTLMAGAIDDNCLITEFQNGAKNIGEISVLASMKDTVLSRLFPLGNFVAGILAQGHPWLHAAIGHCGPAQSWPANFQGPFMIPDAWNFDHGNYLQISPPPVPKLTLPVNVPPKGSVVPAGGVTGWQEAFTAGFESSRFQ
jgi:pimeloyl-ACP methyl ester carboxylesterase